MNLYFLDCPLRRHELCEARAMLPAPQGHRRIALHQRRLPWVLPVPGRDGRYAVSLHRYVRIMERHFLHAGAGSVRRGEPAALLLPVAHARLGGVLALALRGVSGAMPVLVIRNGPGLRVVDASDLLEWAGSLPVGGNPRGAS